MVIIIYKVPPLKSRKTSNTIAILFQIFKNFVFIQHILLGLFAIYE